MNELNSLFSDFVQHPAVSSANLERPHLFEFYLEGGSGEPETSGKCRVSRVDFERIYAWLYAEPRVEDEEIFYVIDMVDGEMLELYVQDFGEYLGLAEP